jgi:hypothetical protein
MVRCCGDSIAAVARLEARVGARLLDRTPRAVSLADEGRCFHTQVATLARILTCAAPAYLAEERFPLFAYHPLAICRRQRSAPSLILWSRASLRPRGRDRQLVKATPPPRAPGESVASSVYGAPAARTRALPKLRPSSMAMKAVGAFSKPSVMSSRYRILPSWMPAETVFKKSA